MKTISRKDNFGNSGVGGWLLLFLIFYIIQIFQYAYMGYYSIANANSTQMLGDLKGFSPNFRMTEAIKSQIYYSNMFYGGFLIFDAFVCLMVVIMILKHSKDFYDYYPFYNFIIYVMPTIIMMLTTGAVMLNFVKIGVVAMMFAFTLFVPIIIFILINMYFKRSTRVKNTFGR